MVDLYGRITRDCPTPDPCERPAICPDDCEMVTAVMESLPVPIYRREALALELTRAMLFELESVTQKLCSTADICERGAAIGLPCFACVYADFNVTTSTCDACLQLIEPDAPSLVDVSQAPHLAIYTALVDALEGFAGVAGWDAMQQVLNTVGGSVIGLIDETYSVELPNNTDVLNIIKLIDNVLPVPAGATVNYYIRVC